ncbi:MAG: 50S ribosomal protein L3 N(5)-glutamine methyltransferase [Cardiobacteriales bacterium]|nr:MAG: 50S ribosomal protein L3 N(5)-glutamine methyltransferase [Cardiobacteriales bacterium]
MKNLKTITDFIRYACTQFTQANLYYGHGTDNAFDEAAALVLGLLKLPYDLHFAYFSANLTDEEQQILFVGIHKRINEHMPVPYITHRTFYGGVEFYVDQRVLIPRSPIVEMIESGMQPWWEGTAPQRILDLCCGSGCLGILAKLYQPQAELVLADIDPQALDVCAINIDRLGIDDGSITMVESDGFQKITGQFDWIICNPPYVEEEEMKTIVEEYHYEPVHALISGSDGLELTRVILKQASRYLTDNGLLILEVGMTWTSLEEAYPDLDFEWVEFERGGQGVCVINADELKAWELAGLLAPL